MIVFKMVLVIIYLIGDDGIVYIDYIDILVILLDGFEFVNRWFLFEFSLFGIIVVVVFNNLVVNIEKYLYFIGKF